MSENLKELGLTFTVTQGELTGHRVIELIPGGEQMTVTSQNLPVYLVYMGDFYLNRQISAGATAFSSGLYSIISRDWLMMFGPSELPMLLSGTKSDIDTADMRANTVLSGGYTPENPTIILFWKLVESMSPSERAALLKFVTSCPRPPLQGFAYLVPKFAIHNAHDPSRLPTASTCVNLLKLPPYTNLETMRSKVLTAIQSNSGFHLS